MLGCYVAKTSSSSLPQQQILFYSFDAKELAARSESESLPSADYGTQPDSSMDVRGAVERFS